MDLRYGNRSVPVHVKMSWFSAIRELGTDHDLSSKNIGCSIQHKQDSLLRTVLEREIPHKKLDHIFGTRNDRNVAQTWCSRAHQLVNCQLQFTAW